jgi:4-diphosphocytidyl-2-C-methyl-D-erythritol kinase
VTQLRESRTRLRHTEPRLTVAAHAKINLTFEVLGHRADGRHEVATVLQTISLADRLGFAPAASQLSLRHRGLKPQSDDDLILRAAGLFRERTGIAARYDIECAKRIPIAAGLGGGSANAGATLRTLNALCDARLRSEDLEEMAMELGADVPFAIEGGTALGSGTGGALTALPDAPAHWLVLVPIASRDPLKTSEMYGRLEPRDMTDGGATRRQAAAIASGRIDYDAVGSAFARAATERWPETAAGLRALKNAQALAASVSGAGPSVFGLYEKRAAALGGLAAVRAASLPARLHRFVGRVVSA